MTRCSLKNNQQFNVRVKKKAYIARCVSTTAARLEVNAARCCFQEKRRRKGDDGRREMIHVSPLRQPLTQLNNRTACWDAGKHVSRVQPG